MANEIRVLYIAEKASVGRALAGVLGKNIKEGDHIRCGDDAIVAWASGHLLELFEPQDYDEKYGSWTLETLPIIPEKWELKEIPRTKGLLSGIKKLLKEAEVLVNADPSELANAAVRILEDPDLKKSMQEAGIRNLGGVGALDHVVEYCASALGWDNRCTVYEKYRSFIEKRSCGE